MREETVYSFLNESALEELTSSHFDELLSYAKKHELSIKNISGLIELFEYYDALIIPSEK